MGHRSGVMEGCSKESLGQDRLTRSAREEQPSQAASRCITWGIFRENPRAGTRPLTRDPASSGFTLVELTVVLFLMALILGLSALFFGNTLPSAKLSATGRELSATIRQARSLAQLNGTSQAVLVNLDTRRYGIEGRGARSIPPEIGIKVTDPLLGEVQGGTYRILFEATGGVEGAIIDLWNKKRIMRIVTDPILGTVTLK